MNLALILGLITFVGWGTGDVFGVFASRKVGSYQTTFYQFLVGIVICTFMLPLFWSDLSGITVGLLIVNILLGSLYVFANVLANEGFRQSNASVVGVVMQSFPAVVLILSTLIFHDPITIHQIIFVILIFSGVFLCSINPRELMSKKFVMDLGVKYALIAMIIWAIYFTFFRIFADNYGWFLPNYISFLTLPIAMFMSNKLLRLTERPAMVRNWVILGVMALSSVLIRGGDIALNLGLSQGLASTIVPIAGASPILFAVTSALVFKDKITKRQIVGIIFALLGIVGLTLKI